VAFSSSPFHFPFAGHVCGPPPPSIRLPDVFVIAVVPSGRDLPFEDLEFALTSSLPKGLSDPALRAICYTEHESCPGVQEPALQPPVAFSPKNPIGIGVCSLAGFPFGQFPRMA